MDLYLLLKTTHILSSTVLFGTGIGIAFFFLMGWRMGDPAAAWFASRTTVFADMIFTLTAGIIQPLTGFALIHLAGWNPWSDWLVWSYALYLFALACWLPVVWLQILIRNLCGARLRGDPYDEAQLKTYFRCWFALGWPALIALLIVFWLMVAKPA